MLEKQKELTERVRANEKVVAAIGLLGSVVIAILGTGIFQKAEAHMGHSFPTGEWIQKLREHESKKDRTSIDEMLNSALDDMEDNNGSDDSTEQEELLQFQSNGD